MFYNEVLKSFYTSYWPAYPNTTQFRAAFITERSRQWEIKQTFDGLKKNIEYFQSTNLSPAGKYFETEYVRTCSDPENLDRLQKVLSDLKCSVDGLYKSVKDHDETLFSSMNGRLKSSRDCHHPFNEEMLYQINSLLNDVEQLSFKLENLKVKAISVLKLTYFKKIAHRNKGKEKTNGK